MLPLLPLSLRVSSFSCKNKLGEHIIAAELTHTGFAVSDFRMLGRGRLIQWIYWKIIEIILILVSVISFLISWFRYRHLSQQAIKNRKNDQRDLLCGKSSSDEIVFGKLSIIIAIKNEAKYIGKTIRNFESTTIDKSRVEIILVDSGCKDNSLEVARVSLSNILFFDHGHSLRRVLVLSH
jgi:cellulose synthase/poly-beta-1,6-N-acetylglucosamine synthase-like glycosyltransferase